MERTMATLAPTKEDVIALRAFNRIADLWELTGDERMTLLGVSRSTYERLAEGEHEMPRDLKERISYVLGIYKNLQILLPDPRAADGWIRRPNLAPLFNGASALDRMLSGNVADLYVVRKYLDAECQGWY